MADSQRKPFRVCTCTRCAQPFTAGGADLRGCCPSCVSLVVSCWAEGRYRRMLTDLAAATAVRGGIPALVTVLDGALAAPGRVERRAIYLRDVRSRALTLAAPSLGAPATLPSYVGAVLADCVGPVAAITLAEHDVRLGSLAGAAGWSMAVALRSEDDVLGVAFVGCADGTMVMEVDDLAYLAIVASAVGAGLARARTLGLGWTPPRPAPRRDRLSIQRLGWLL